MEQLTVKELINKLQKMPETHKVIFYEKGGCYDISVKTLYISKYDKENNRDQITISG